MITASTIEAPCSKLQGASIASVIQAFLPRQYHGAAGTVLATKQRVRFDRLRRKFKIITRVTVYADGRIGTSTHKKPFEAVPPGSLSEALSNDVCVTRE